MKRKLEILSIYLTGLFQGLALVTVPAASLVFTGKFGFSSSEYGLLFIPQVLTAIAASLLGPTCARRWGMKAVFRLGLVFNLLAMVLIAASQLVSDNHSAAYLLVILGTTFVGAGFGSTLPTINVYATNFFPKKSASALTVLHTLLGIGTALAPFLVTILVERIGWWLLPVVVMAALMVLLAGAFILPLEDERPAAAPASPLARSEVFLPARVRLFMLIVLLYGFCETIFANWAIIFLNTEKGIPIKDAGYALAAFWVMVSVGRLLVSIVSVWVSPIWVYRILPVLMMGSLVAVTRVSSPMAGILIFGMAGLSCSAFFPLTFSFGQKGFELIAERVSGWIMASYMLGYGLAAYGIGKIIELTHTLLGAWYLNATMVALATVVLSFILTQQRRSIFQETFGFRLLSK